MFLCLFIYFRDPGAEQKFKDISNAYEVSPTGHAETLYCMKCTFLPANIKMVAVIGFV
jgi:hypothetical protein